MLKPQDYLILLKLLANPGTKWSQRELAQGLCISLAEVNNGLKRLEKAGLLRKVKQSQCVPIISAAEEFLIHGLRYLFPGKLGGLPEVCQPVLLHHYFTVKLLQERIQCLFGPMPKAKLGA